MEDLFLCFIVLLIALAIFTPFFSKYKKSKWQKSLPASFKYIYYDQLNGIAIDPSNKKIILCELNKEKTYSLSDIRNCELNWITSIKNNNWIANVEKKNESNIAIVFSMKDIDNPKWEIIFGKKSTAEKWLEIINQFYEGKLQ